ncbi:HAD family hydrolase [Nocardioides daeguensis]|uniref:Cation-translocating P-type ATPase n=1 Tax=Nocardioides daeguensis TaxID=908359 RepID=A0ABP6VEF4_9ACTN|nr:HAD family hydrolase [Nocardioides daeguensis]MBV6729379.1 HAD family hydrolase [Nocardioides daeguensis]MCR1771848.1 HAD family hydrolase [Nocardioides daeguensis]
MTVVVLLLVLLPAFVGLLPWAAWWAMRRSRRDGVDFPDLAALRTAGRVDTVVLDRWGTVTTGELVVTDIDPVEEGNERNLKWFAAALQHAVEGDPVARAIARLAGPGKLTDVELVAGRGTSGAVDRHPVRVGAPAWLGMETRDGLGETVGVEVDHRPFGYLTVSDQVRPDAPLAVARLRAAGVEPILLSDADVLDTEHLAQACGIDKWIRGEEAAEREQAVRDQRGGAHCVAVVARGQDNAEILASADLAFSEAGRGVRMVDLDVQRVARALEVARGIPSASLRVRATGLVASGIGGSWGLVDGLSLVAAGAVLVVGCLAVVTVAWSAGRRA